MKLRFLLILLSLYSAQILATQPILMQSFAKEKRNTSSNLTLLYLSPETLFQEDALSCSYDLLCIQDIYTDVTDIYELFKSHYTHFLFIPSTTSSPGTLFISKYALVDNENGTFTLYNDTDSVASICTFSEHQEIPSDGIPLTHHLVLCPLLPYSISTTSNTIEKAPTTTIEQQSQPVYKKKLHPKEELLVCKNSNDKDPPDREISGSLRADRDQTRKSTSVKAEAEYSERHSDGSGWSASAEAEVRRNDDGSMSAGAEVKAKRNF